MKFDRKTGLSPRQLEILPLLADGMSNEEIGARLYMSEHTVKCHLRELFEWMGARNRAHCVHIAHEKGLIGAT